jgi:uncharacterized membrane protein YheB (UPF0754 family)
MDPKLFLPPIIGALIGWFTNYVAIKLLFRPHRPVNVLGYKLQGLIPKRRREIARSMANSIEKDLFSSKDIAGLLDTIDIREEVEHSVEEVVEHRFGSERLKGIPVVGLVSDNLKNHLKYLITKEILKQVEKKKHGIKDKLLQNVDVKGVVESKIDNLDLVKFEELLQGFIAKELKHLELLGLMMGFLIGVFQAGLFYFFW